MARMPYPRWNSRYRARRPRQYPRSPRRYLSPGYYLAGQRGGYRWSGRRKQPLGWPYMLMLALIIAIITMWGLEWAERSGSFDRPAPAPFAVPTSGPQSLLSGGPAAFSICGSGRRVNCVVDGDTFWMEGEKIRILDIDTPELHPARCAEEERLGEAAKARLHELLNGGAVTLERAGRDRDRYGRLLRRVEVNGQPVGAVLIGEGLARPYAGGRRSWC
ncbi:MAG: thermonuclease family protein [Parasphingopyxis sp.]